jgi:hypothetical protein
MQLCLYLAHCPTSFGLRRVPLADVNDTGVALS